VILLRFARHRDRTRSRRLTSPLCIAHHGEHRHLFIDHARHRAHLGLRVNRERGVPFFANVKMHSTQPPVVDSVASGAVALGASHSAVPLATSIRTTLLAASTRSLKQAGLYDKYLQHLPVEHHERIEAIMPGGWLPIGVASAHYAACDRLALPPAVIAQLAGDCSRFFSTVIYTVLSRLARAAGASPWLALDQAERLRTLTWKGSEIVVTRTGPNEAHYAWLGQPLAASPYFRVASTAWMRGVLTLFTPTARVRLLERESSPTTLVHRCSWL